MDLMTLIGDRKVLVSRVGVRCFNAQWPCSELRDSRAYWFEFDKDRNLVDSDVPEQDDGSAAAAMSADAETFLFDGTLPAWAQP